MKREIESVLQKWKNEKDRVPIILRGARQVGKSYIIETFGKKNFESVAIANFEFQPELVSCFESLDPKTICLKLEMLLNQRIVPEKTLLFLDEIQNCPKAIVALRYFKEKMQSLHVIAAGSLLEFALHKEDFSFPVGRVSFLYLKPLSFREFLIGLQQVRLVEWIDTVSLKQSQEEVIHQHLLNFYRQYLLIGGMPAVVKDFIEKNSFLECQHILSRVLDTYRSDFSKYTTKTQYKYLEEFFSRAPTLIGQHFKYSHINPELRSRELKIALEQLGWAGLLHRVIASSASGIPLYAHAKENKFKLLFLDLGLMNVANQINLSAMWEKSPSLINAGGLAEQFVGQELLAYADPHTNMQLFYWERDKKGAMAEVDFVIQVDHQIIPIEVKAGTTGQLRSLNQFMTEKKSSVGVRISQHPLSLHDHVLSVPFYLIGQIPRLLREI